MKVHTTSPYQFTTGELLDPERHATNIVYAHDVVEDVTSKRYSHSAVVYQFQESCAVGYTDALNQESRTFRFFCANTIMLERAFLRYVGTGVSVQIVLTDVATALPPPNASNPILLIATGDTSATFVRPVTLVAGHQYTFELTAAGVFAAELAELELHLRSDRYIPAGIDTSIDPDLVLLTEVDPLDAETFLGTVSPISTAAANNFGTSFVAALKPLVVVQHNFSNNAAFTNLLRFDLPRVTNTQRRENLVRVFLAAVMPGATVGAAGQTVSLQIQDAAGGVLSTTTISVAGVTRAQGMATVAVDLGSATASIKSNSAADYRLVLSTNNATALFKAYAAVFVE